MESTHALLNHLLDRLNLTDKQLTDNLDTPEAITAASEAADTALAALLEEAAQAAHQKATKQARYTVEKELKAAGLDYGFDKGKTFDLNVKTALEALESKVAENAQAQQPNQLSEEQILKLAPVIKLKNELTLEAERREKEGRQQERETLRQEREEFELRQQQGKLRTQFQQQLAELSPIFSTDPQKAANQARDLEDKVVQAGRWQTTEAGTYLLDSEGEIKKDRLGKPTTLESLTREITTNYYDLPASKPKQNANLTQQDLRPPATGYTGPATEEAYLEQKAKATSPEERVALRKLWESKPPEPGA